MMIHRLQNGECYHIKDTKGKEKEKVRVKLYPKSIIRSNFMAVHNMKSTVLHTVT